MRLLIAVLVCAACTGPIAGTRVNYQNKRTPPAGPAVATASAAAPGGLRVLAHTNADEGDAGLLATNADELAALWSDVGLRSAPPVIDFATHVALGSNFEDGVCHPEIVAAHVDATGLLKLERASLADSCILLAARTSLVVAIPRSILPPRFVWRTSHGDFAFDLAPRASVANALRPVTIVDTGARSTIAKPRGTLALPALGRVALRALDDGREVWVARRDADDITVILADRPTATRGLHSAVTWNDKTHRFDSGHDSRGRSLHGASPLDVLAHARAADERIVVGDPIAVTPAPLVARDDEPALDGPATPYTTTPRSSFYRIRDGHIGVTTDNLVFGTEGIPQLCTIPEGKARRSVVGCRRSHPTDRGPAISMIHGPLAFRRDNNDVSLVIDLGRGRTSWTVDRVVRPPFAPNGPSRQRDALPVGVTVTGSTTGANNGYTAPVECVSTVGGGSPDETWTFTPPRAGIYVFELETEYDGTLAIVDPTAPPHTSLACNDDAKGFYRRSAIRIELATQTKLRVVVDGYAAERGAYRLTVHEQAPLPHLEVGGTVNADTTNAIDLEAHGCHAPAGDHRYPLAIREAGRYSFRVVTTGWAPMLSVFRAGGSEFGCYTRISPLVDSHLLEPGDHFVVIDGNDKKQSGPYILRVDRCSTDDEKACEAEARTP
jgi:hypothetical protein